MPHSGREDALSFFPNPTMQTYLALPPDRAHDELPCIEEGRLTQSGVKKTCMEPYRSNYMMSMALPWEGGSLNAGGDTDSGMLVSSRGCV